VLREICKSKQMTDGRVRKVPKMYYLNVWNFSDPIVEVNAVVRHFRQPWVFGTFLTLSLK
jgi:hypothetical protein